jgi:hypothetical protein
VRRRNHRHSHWLNWLCAGLLLLLTAGPGLADSPRFWPAVRSSTGWSVALAPGILYSHYTVGTAAGPLSIHHLGLDLGNPEVRLGMGLAHDRLISGDETVSSMVARAGAVAGINGDFFDIGDSGMPLNIAVKDGVLLRSPDGWVALAIGKDGSARIVRYRWTGSVLLPTTRATYWLAGFNTGFVPDGIVAVSNVRGYGPSAPGPGVQQAVVELAPATGSVSAPAVAPTAASPADSAEASRGAFLVAPGQMIPLPSRDEGTLYTVRQVWNQQAYYAPFPKGEVLLVGRGSAADWLRRNVAAGMPIQVNLSTTPDWHDLHIAVGGGPLLVQHGRIVDDPDSPVPNERYVRNPVSAVGITRDGRTMLLVAIDGRQPRLSIGLTQPQLAAYMRWLGAYQAMEFDSGGSVTMAVHFPGRPWPVVVNSPSDGHERPVANALLVFSMPVARQSPR